MVRLWPMEGGRKRSLALVCVDIDERLYGVRGVSDCLRFATKLMVLFKSRDFNKTM